LSAAGWAAEGARDYPEWFTACIFWVDQVKDHAERLRRGGGNILFIPELFWTRLGRSFHLMRILMPCLFAVKRGAMR